jgi:hypothetical protein
MSKAALALGVFVPIPTCALVLKVAIKLKANKVANNFIDKFFYLNNILI